MHSVATIAGRSPYKSKNETPRDHFAATMSTAKPVACANNNAIAKTFNPPLGTNSTERKTRQPSDVKLDATPGQI